MRLVLLVSVTILVSMLAAATLFQLAGGDAVTFARRLDDLIDARMAATLAGLSLTAASFTRDTPRRPDEPDADYLRRHRQNQTATRLLVNGFYVFTALLAIGLSFDPLFEPKPVRGWLDLIGWAELVTSATGVALGLGFLVAGAHRLVVPEPATADGSPAH